MSKAAATATVVAVAGRRIDAPDAAVERFPLHNRDHVRQAILSRLACDPVSAVVSSAACGADLLALDAARELGIRRRIILPFDVGTFRQESVVDRPGDWGPLYDAIVSDVMAVGDLLILDARPKQDLVYEQLNREILSEASKLVEAKATRRLALVVWEGTARASDDHTQHFLTMAAADGWTVDEIFTR